MDKVTSIVANYIVLTYIIRYLDDNDVEALSRTNKIIREEIITTSAWKTRIIYNSFNLFSQKYTEKTKRNINKQRKLKSLYSLRELFEHSIHVDDKRYVYIPMYFMDG